MKEIGGYFGLEKLVSNEYHKDLIAVNSARNALWYLLRVKKIRKLYIPYFLCDSVFKLCNREGVVYEYYNIGKDFLPVFDRTLDEDECLYIVNYYGQVSDAQIQEFRMQYGNIIMDHVQAFFQRPVVGVDTIYSCRKYFGVPDGAYVYSTVKLEEELPEDRSVDRMKHILGRFEGACASDYYADYQGSEDSLAALNLAGMSALTHNILGAVDYEKVRKKRDENFAVLASMLGTINKLSVKIPVGAFAYPFYFENGTELKQHLIRKKIYVPTLWPNVLEREGTLEKEYAENILPLPVDQRYGRDEMEYMVREIWDYLEK